MIEMNIKQKIKNALLATVAAAMMYAPVYAKKPDLKVSVGVEAAQNGVLVDSKIDWNPTQNDSTKKFSYFNRTKLSADYENAGNFFSLFDVRYKLGKSINALAELWFSSKGILPRLGASFLKKAGNFKLYTAHTLSPLDYAAFVKLAHSKNQGGLAISSENLGKFDETGLNSYASTNKLGYKVDNYTFGITNSTSLTLDDKLDVANYIGGFAQVDF